jgi:hypothetical protein
MGACDDSRNNLVFRIKLLLVDGSRNRIPGGGALSPPPLPPQPGCLGKFNPAVAIGSRPSIMKEDESRNVLFKFLLLVYHPKENSGSLKVRTFYTIQPIHISISLLMRVWLAFNTIGNS